VARRAVDSERTVEAMCQQADIQGAVLSYWVVELIPRPVARTKMASAVFFPAFWFVRLDTKSIGKINLQRG